MNDALHVLEFGDDVEMMVESPSSAQAEDAPTDWFAKSEAIADKHQIQSLQFGVGDWLNQAKALAEKHQTATLQWEIGDWFNLSPLPDDVPGVPKAYDIAEELFCISRATLYDWASTAQRVPVSIRTEKLKFTHHRVIANGLPGSDEATKKLWIDIAVQEKLGVRELKERLRASRASNRPEPDPTKSLIIKLPVKVYGVLNDIARGRESKVQCVAAEFLTEYLASDEVRTIAESELAAAEERTYQRRRRAGVRTARAYDPLGIQQ